jgi:hypothetical protein
MSVMGRPRLLTRADVRDAVVFERVTARMEIDPALRDAAIAAVESYAEEHAARGGAIDV